MWRPIWIGLLVALALFLPGPLTGRPAAQERPTREAFIDLLPDSGTADTEIRVAGWVNCPREEAEAFIFFGRQLAVSTAVVWPAPDEDFVPHDEWDFFASFTPSSVFPDQIEPGAHKISVSCRRASGRREEAAGTFTIEGQPGAQEEQTPATEVIFFYPGLQTDEPARPGEKVNAVGSFPADPTCERVFLFFEGKRIAETPTHLDRAGFSGLLFNVPTDAETGDRRLAVSCDPSGSPIAVSGILRVAGSVVSDVANEKRSFFVNSLHGVSDLDWSPRHVGTNLVVAVLLLLLVFPAEVFNSTLDANYDEVRGWFGLKKRAAVVSAMEERGFRNTWIAFGLLGIISSVVYGFLDPSFGLNQASFGLLVGLIVGFAVVTLIFGVPTRAYMKKAHQDTGRINVAFGALVLAILCVVLSRLTKFLPGYLYGVLAGFVFRAELSKQNEGGVNAFTVISVLVASVAAWLAWLPVRRIAEAPDASFALVILEATLVAIFVAGVESSFIGLVPMRYLKGEKLFAWNKVVWAILFVLSGFLFVQVLLRPGAGTTETPMVTVVALFVGFALLSGAFWAYFRYRKPRQESASQAPVTEDSSMASTPTDEEIPALTVPSLVDAAAPEAGPAQESVSKKPKRPPVKKKASTAKATSSKKKPGPKKKTP